VAGNQGDQIEALNRAVLRLLAEDYPGRDPDLKADKKLPLPLCFDLDGANALDLYLFFICST